MPLIRHLGKLLRNPAGKLASVNCCCPCCCRNTLPATLVLTFHRAGECGDGSPEEGGNFDDILGSEVELHQVSKHAWEGTATVGCGWTWAFTLRCDTEETECPRYVQESNWFLDWEITAVDPDCVIVPPTSGTALTQGSGLAVATCDPFYAEFHIGSFETSTQCECCTDCRNCELFVEVAQAA